MCVYPCKQSVLVGKRRGLEGVRRGSLPCLSPCSRAKRCLKLLIRVHVQVSPGETSHRRRIDRMTDSLCSFPPVAPPPQHLNKSRKDEAYDYSRTAKMGVLGAVVAGPIGLWWWRQMASLPGPLSSLLPLKIVLDQVRGSLRQVWVQSCAPTGVPMPLPNHSPEPEQAVKGT